jgi:catechol 2,3-dioxygenase-like lactoylglutathione lyase family enzyme
MTGTDPGGGAAARVDHVAVHVTDLPWHVRFFDEVFGMSVTGVAGDPAAPAQVWLTGGLQLLRRASGEPAGRDPRAGDVLAHVALDCPDRAAAIERARARGAVTLPDGDNWLRLPEGWVLELVVHP